MTASLLVRDRLRGKISWNNTTTERRGWRVCTLIGKHRVHTRMHAHTHIDTHTGTKKHNPLAKHVRSQQENWQAKR